MNADRPDSRTSRDGDEADDPKRSSGVEDPIQSEALPESVECPFCAGSETEVFAAFGSAVSVSQYYCRACRTVFEWMKWRR